MVCPHWEGAVGEDDGGSAFSLLLSLPVGWEKPFNLCASGL